MLVVTSNNGKLIIQLEWPNIKVNDLKSDQVFRNTSEILLKVSKGVNILQLGPFSHTHNILVHARKITNYKMDNAQASDRLQDLYLTGVRPNGDDIGVGAYGKVFEVEYCGDVYAAKEIHSILVQGVRREEFEATKKAFLTECIRSGSLSHPNVVHFLGVYNPGGQSLLPVLVMERMQESLTSVVEKYPNIPMYVKLSMLLDVSRGLWYLHTHHPPIVHRDLSPNNVLLTSQFMAKISDFGVAKVIQADSKKTKTRAPGTVDFMPPEALLETPEYGPPLDLFSYGGVILHVVNQEWPKPLHYVMTDPKTGKILGLSEVERRQQHNNYGEDDRNSSRSTSIS